ncbi:spore germination protein [Paenibacillus amylolyticus]|nr:spore germination protein [Paenibacillus amylolyticus]
MNLIRRQIISPSLIVRYFNVGREDTYQNCSCISSGLGQSRLVNEVEERITSISSDMVLTSRLY